MIFQETQGVFASSYKISKTEWLTTLSASTTPYLFDKSACGVGYALVKIVPEEGSPYGYLIVSILKQVVLPKIDGEYQTVTEEQVQTVIDQIKTST